MDPQKSGWSQQDLVAYLDGELPGRDEAMALAHAAELGELERVRQLYRGLGPVLPAPSYDRVLQAIAADYAVTTRWLRSRTALLSAIVVLATIGTVAWLAYGRAARTIGYPTREGQRDASVVDGQPARTGLAGEAVPADARLRDMPPGRQPAQPRSAVREGGSTRPPGHSALASAEGPLAERYEILLDLCSELAAEIASQMRTKGISEKHMMDLARLQSMVQELRARLMAQSGLTQSQD